MRLRDQSYDASRLLRVSGQAVTIYFDITEFFGTQAVPSSASASERGPPT